MGNLRIFIHFCVLSRAVRADLYKESRDQDIKAKRPKRASLTVFTREFFKNLNYGRADSKFLVNHDTCVWVLGYLGFLGVPLKWDTAFLGGEPGVQSRDWETERGKLCSHSGDDCDSLGS